MKTDDVASKYYTRECDLRVLACLSQLASQKAIINATLASGEARLRGRAGWTPGWVRLLTRALLGVAAATDQILIFDRPRAEAKTVK